MELAAALHHSRDVRPNETNVGLRGQVTASSGTRLDAVKEPVPRLGTMRAACQRTAAPSLVLAVLGGGDDGLDFFLAAYRKEEEREAAYDLPTLWNRYFRKLRFSGQINSSGTGARSWYGDCIIVRLQRVSLHARPLIQDIGKLDVDWCSGHQFWCIAHCGMVISRRLAVPFNGALNPLLCTGAHVVRTRESDPVLPGNATKNWRGGARKQALHGAEHVREMPFNPCDSLSFTSVERTVQLDVACRIQVDLYPSFKSVFGHTKNVRWTTAPHDQSSAVRLFHSSNLNAYKSGLPHQAGLYTACIRDALITHFKR